jgi:hypothetical protein
LLRTAERLAEDPPAGQDSVAVAKAVYVLGIWSWNRLESGKAAELFLRARQQAEAAGARSVRRQAQLGLALTFVTGSTPIAQALGSLVDLVGAAQGDRMAESMLMTYTGVLEGMRGQFADGRDLLARASEQLDDLGHRVLRASLDHYAALAELAADDPVAAERIARRALDALLALGERANAALLAAILAEALHRQGRDVEAESQLAFASEAESGALLIHVRVRTTRAKVLARRGDAMAAEEVAREAIALLESTDALVLRGDSYLSLCEALDAGGRLNEAATAAATAESAYALKGASALAAGAAARRALLIPVQRDQGRQSN